MGLIYQLFHIRQEYCHIDNVVELEQEVFKVVRGLFCFLLYGLEEPSHNILGLFLPLPGSRGVDLLSTFTYNYSMLI